MYCFPSGGRGTRCPSVVFGRIRDGPAVHRAHPGAEFTTYCVWWTNPIPACMYETWYRAATMPDWPANNPCESHELTQCTRGSAEAVLETYKHYWLARYPSTTVTTHVDYSWSTGAHLCVDWSSTGSLCDADAWYDAPEDANARQNLGKPCEKGCGNPINFTTGNKFQRETDIDASPLPFERYYNSDPAVRVEPAIGLHWTHTYSYRLKGSTVGGVDKAVLQRPDGREIDFSLTAGVWVSAVHEEGVLTKVFSGSTHTGWTYAPDDGRHVEVYDALGRLTAIDRADGRGVELEYNHGALDGSGNDYRLTRVTGPDGRSLWFTYDALRRIASVADDAATRVEYTYDTF